MKAIVNRNFSRNPGNAGFCDVAMAYAMGLRALGHEVYVLDEVEPWLCCDSEGQPVPFESWEGRARFESLMRLYDVWPNACLVYEEGAATYGMAFEELVEVARDSDLLVVVGGRVKTPEVLDGVASRAFVDVNPGKTQVWAYEYGVDYGFDRFDHLFTVGLNIGTPACELPTGGRDWTGILPPVHVPMWPARIDAGCERFTTISTWAGRSTFDFGGVYSGEKSDEWLRLAELPRLTERPLEIAVRIEDGYAPHRELLLEHGWSLRDPAELSGFEDYRGYISGSRGELSAAHSRYVRFDTGWVSDRTARYLAAGKPAVVQSTAFEERLPPGSGLLTFRTPDEAAEAIAAVDADYLEHCRAARALAEQSFDASVVLGRMLATMGAAPAVAEAP